MQKTIRILKAASDQNRMRILIVLSFRPACVCELVWALDISQPNLSHHLRILEDAGLIEGQRNGNWMEYKLSSDSLTKELLEFLKHSNMDDRQIQTDITRLKTANRNQICQKEEIDV